MFTVVVEAGSLTVTVTAKAKGEMAVESSNRTFAKSILSFVCL
jgi:hypothetical protein